MNFEYSDFDVATFRDYKELTDLCAAPAASSFWCSRLDDTLTFIPTKGVDFFFDEAGELVGLFSKQQKGQDFSSNGGYRQGINAGQNLIPVGSSVPGGAVLLNGDYQKPENIESSWQKTGDTEITGIFSYTLGDIAIEKQLVVSNITNVLDVSLTATRADGSDASEAVAVQYALPGIAKSKSPVFKIGQGETFSENPVSQAVSSPSYISVQSNARPVSSSTALILRPFATTDDLSALFLSPNIISLEKELAAEPGSSVQLEFEQYGGQNELVRYYQEGFKDLPGLFNPNILGQMSLGILWALQQIHKVVGNWGLTIILLTLLFRLLVWPLISTQTRSMYAMQRLQPKLQELQKKYKDDREKLTQETMKLYQTEKVNPAGGCLPALVQMPLFIILWRVFVNFEFNEGFLWIPDLGQPDPTYILPILYVGVIFAQSYFMSQGNKQSLQQQLMINAVFIFFVISFPAGVTLYWVTSMLVQVFQYWLIRRSQPKVAALSK
ncbi:MAG: membrane protein insertase YidC [Trueperaceae bacterium]|nr:membrane protein insertase YidC [Trueperaceae bacterium]